MPDRGSMKKNVPKFLIAKNEAASPGAAYIVHTQEPSFIAEIKRFDSLEKRDEYMADNTDKEFLIIDHTFIVEHKRYLEAPEESRQKTYLANKMKHWVIANVINSSVF